MNDDDLTPEERARLEALPRGGDPPAHLEERVVRALRAEGVLRAPRRSRPPLLLAAAVALFAAGLAAGRLSSPPRAAQAHGPRFLLLLFDASSTETPDEGSRVAEYRAWARTILHPGSIVRGDKLAPGGRLLDGSGATVTEAETDASPAGSVLGGLFVVEAADWSEALALARTCPHLAHGGRVFVRRIQELS